MSQSTVKLVNFNDSDDGMVFVLQAASTEQLANEITDYLRSREYRLESGTALNGIWGTGNAFLRALLGGLVKRYKFQLTSEGRGADHAYRLVGPVEHHAQAEQRYERSGRGTYRARTDEERGSRPRARLAGAPWLSLLETTKC